MFNISDNVITIQDYNTDRVGQAWVCIIIDLPIVLGNAVYHAVVFLSHLTLDVVADTVERVKTRPEIHRHTNRQLPQELVRLTGNWLKIGKEIC